ncbi:hypothetical protein FRB99_002969 [Tulasnella sp. 403]|nr:hypothetical protein FRB99_002969 [Tulasnella sp. 403]
MAVSGPVTMSVLQPRQILSTSKDDRRRQTNEQIKAIDQRTAQDRLYWTGWFLRNPMAGRRLPQRGRPLRLLSLDGGGVRGVMSLVILQHLMDRVAPNTRPCDYFDLIGGTSTGGLIAIMLGRLRMTIPQCIRAYRELAQAVFDVSLLEQAINLLDAHRFSGDELKAAVQLTVQRYQGTSSTKLWDNPDNRNGSQPCKTFVVAIPGCNVNRPAKLFRTYNNRFLQQSADRCEIWEAALATSCAPSFFPEIKVENVVYADGGLGYNNPARLVLEEARSLWGHAHPIGCLLSLGTGLIDHPMLRFQTIQDIPKIFSTFRGMAVDCERVHQELEQNVQVKRFYHRFNPRLPKKISLDEWKKIQKLEEIAVEHLRSHSTAVTACVTALT